MRVAIPVHGPNISPRFDYAPEMIVVEVRNGAETARHSVTLEGLNTSARLDKIRDENADTIICGNIDVFSEQALESMGIRLIPWVTGEVVEAIGLFLENKLVPGMILGPKGQCGHWGLGARRGMCRRGRWFREMEERGEEYTMPRGDGTGPAGQGPGTGRGQGRCGGGNKGADGGRKSGTAGGRGRGQGGGGGQGAGKGGGRGRGGNR